MSAILATAQTGEVSLTAATAETVLQIVAAANHRVKIKEVSVSFNGTSNTAEPADVTLVRQTSAGTMSALTPQKIDASVDETLQTTAQHTATAEPTGSTVIKAWKVHPQGGIEWQAPFGGELLVAGGGRLGVVITAPANVDCVVGITFEE